MQQKQDGSSGDKVIGFAHVLAASFASLVAAAAHRWRPESCTVVVDEKIKPHLERIESGRVARIEKFSQYVARQIGFEEDDKVPKLCILAQDYLRKSKGCDQSIYEYLAKEKDGDNLYVKLIDEFERCILSYFAFHWTQAPSITTQVLNTESQQKTKLKEILLAATWKQRFERVNKDLKVTRVFSTLVEELKVIHAGDSQSKDVMVPMAHSERSPVLLFMGGGMGAGKSTVLKDILKEPFWLGAATNAVVVEADAFKENDVIYRALNSRGHHAGMLETSESVHQSSTDAASSLLVTALNEGRDVIMDGTLSWEPFVEQTIAMARNVHKRMYRMGVGYKQAEDGTVTENYWEQVNEAGEEYLLEKNSKAEPRSGKPYRIELVGVVCDGYLAVIRGISYSKKCMFGNSFENHGEIKITVKRLKQKLKAVASVHHDFDFIIHYRRISKYAINYYFVGDVIFGYGKVDIPIGTFIYRRAIMTGRAVRVNSQLTSHKRFANAFPRYCNLVDHARLFSTNSIGGPPKLIGLKDGGHNLLVDPEDITCMKKIGSMNAEADSIYELYRESSIIKEPGSVWNDFVMSPSRPNYQKELRESILKIEKSITESTVARNTAAKT